MVKNNCEEKEEEKKINVAGKHIFFFKWGVTLKLKGEAGQKYFVKPNGPLHVYKIMECIILVCISLIFVVVRNKFLK